MTSTEQRWYTADHYKSDSYYHTYCGECFDQIPSWLVRWYMKEDPPFVTSGQPMVCEGCGKESAVVASDG